MMENSFESEVVEQEMVVKQESTTLGDIYRVIDLLKRSRKMIGGVVSAATVFAIVVSLILPKSYKSTTVLLPETDKGKLTSLMGLSGLASLAGIDVGEASLEKLYPSIITSEAILREAIYAMYKTEKYADSVNLIKFWEIEEDTPLEDFESAVEKMRDDLDIKYDRQLNTVEISISTREAQLSADVLNRITLELDRFIRTKRATNAGEQRKWIEARLAEVKEDLRKAENALKEFREKNRRIIDSPQLLLEQERMIREVEINSTLYVELKKQYEIVKIEEIKNVPIISVMDEARAAARKERPKRSIIVLTSLFLSAVAAMGYVIVGYRYKAKVVSLLKTLSTSS